MGSKTDFPSDLDVAAVEAVIAASAGESYTYRGTRYPVHPAAHLFPLIEGERYRDMLVHCKKHGIAHPVRLFKGAIVDGRNRLRIAIEEDLDVRFEEIPPDSDPCRLVETNNLMRRDMAPQQRSVVARQLRDLSRYEFLRREKRFAATVAAEPKSDPVTGEVVTPASAVIGPGDTAGMGAHDPLPVRPSAAPSGGPVAPKAAKAGPKGKEGGFVPTPSRATAAAPQHSSGSEDSDPAASSDDDLHIVGGLVAPLSTGAAAKMMAVSDRDVRRIDELAASAPELVDAVKDGVVSIREALDPEVKAAPEDVRREALEEVKTKGGGASFKQAVQRLQKDRGVAPGPKKRKGAAPKGRKAGSAGAGGTTEIQELPDLTMSNRRDTGNVSPADDPVTAHEVYSPSRLVLISRVLLGGIDLDPASSEEAQLNVEAREWFGRDDNGLSLPWKERVYCFPPPNQVSGFADKLGMELMAGHTKRAVFLAATQSGPEWAQKLLANPALTMIVVMRGEEPLVMEPLEKGGRPGVWRPPSGLTAYVFGIEPTEECCEKWAVWGLPFVLSSAAAKAA